MPIFNYGNGPLRDFMRGIGDNMRGVGVSVPDSVGGNAANYVAQNFGGLMNNYTGWRDQANLEETWRREDTAVQRRMADLEAAGVNPMADFMGSGATSAPTHSPGQTQGRQNPVADAMSIAQFDKQLAIMDAQVNQMNSVVDLNEARGNRERIETMLAQQEHDFLKQYNPARIAEMSARLRNLDLEAEGRRLDLELKELGIDQSKIDLVRSRLGIDFDRLGIDARKQQLILNQIAIDQAKVSLEGSEWDLSLALRDGTFVGKYNIAQAVATAVRSLGDYIGERIPSGDDIVSRVRELPPELLDVVTGDADAEDPRWQQIWSRVLGYVPSIWVARKLISRIRGNRDESTGGVSRSFAEPSATRSFAPVAGEEWPESPGGR